MDQDFNFRQDTGKVEVSRDDIQLLIATLESPVYVQYDSKHDVPTQAAEIRGNRISSAVITLRGWL